jgi:hypothetical protein
MRFSVCAAAAHGISPKAAESRQMAGNSTNSQAFTCASQHRNVILAVTHFVAGTAVPGLSRANYSAVTVELSAAQRVRSVLKSTASGIYRTSTAFHGTCLAEGAAHTQPEVKCAAHLALFNALLQVCS